MRRPSCGYAFACDDCIAFTGRPLDEPTEGRHLQRYLHEAKGTAEVRVIEAELSLDLFGSWLTNWRLTLTAAQRFRQAREAARLSRERLGRASDVSASTIYHVERGEVPTPEIAERLAKALGLDAAELWGE